MKQYKHIFFDLDHTLWDFETNSKLTLEKIFADAKLLELGVASFDKFHDRYLPINNQYWARYHKGIVNKSQLRIGRFRDTLLDFGINNDDLAEQMAQDYLTHSPRQTALFPYAIEVLQYLCSKYKVHIITNGFAEVQRVKIESSGLSQYFDKVIISEEVNTQKPDVKIFEHTIEAAGAVKDECVMIGDNLSTDIAGARNAGIDQIYFNPYKESHREKVTYEISSLIQLKDIL